MKSSLIISPLLICFILFARSKCIHGEEEAKKNKFREREASDDALGYPEIDEDALLNTQCPRNLELRWQTEVSSSIYANPLIADINSDGKPEIVVPSFVHYLEVLEGADGDKMPGWPAFHQSTIHASPLLYDIDKDGVREIALATYNGEVLFFRVSGYMMTDKLEIPRRRVRKDWYVGLNSDPVDRSHPDVHDELLVMEANKTKLMSQTNGSIPVLNHTIETTMNESVPVLNHTIETTMNGSVPVLNHTIETTMNGSVPVLNHTIETTMNGSVPVLNHTIETTMNGSIPVLNHMIETTMNGSVPVLNPTIETKMNGSGPGLNTSTTISTQILNIVDPVDQSHPNVHDEQLVMEANKTKLMSQTNGSVPVLNHTIETTVNGSVPELNTSTTISTQMLNVSDTVNSSNVNDSNVEPDIVLPTSTTNNTSMNLTRILDGKNGTGTSRRLLEYRDSKQSQEDGSKFKADAHVATVENDEPLEAEADSSFEIFRGNDELADEYNYDYDDYIDESMWGDEEWTEVKHETQEESVDIDAHILCTPVIADIDNDGVSEMIVAASYFFDNEYYDNPEHKKELGDIDIGKYVAGAIVVFDLDSKQVKWKTELDLSTDSVDFPAYIYASPTVIDLDGDGNLDILVGTTSGLFYALDHHGKVRKNFPLEMADIQGAVVAADINDDGKIELVTADGHGNVAAWTAQGQEIWEKNLKSLIPQGPSVGDVDGDGHTDVVVPTVSGNIYVLSGKDGSFVRPYPYRTHGKVMNQVLLIDLNKRDDKKKGLTLVTSSFDGYLYLIDGPTSCADVIDIGETSYSMVLADNVDGGDDLDLIVTTMNGNVFCFSTPAPHHPLKAWRSTSQGRNNVAIQHNREGIFISHSSRTYRDEEGKNFWVETEIVDSYRTPSGTQAPYNVTTTLMVPGNYQGERKIKQNQIFKEPGKHRIKLPTVSVRTSGTVLVEMVDKNGLYFSDEFSLTFHMCYYKLLKWLLVLPMLGMFAVLMILRPQEPVPLPSFSRNTNL